MFCSASFSESGSVTSSIVCHEASETENEENSENESANARRDMKYVMRIASGDKARDLRHLVDNFTAPALATALRDRDETLRACARLAAMGHHDKLHATLQPYMDLEPLHAGTNMSNDRGLDTGDGVFEMFSYMHRRELRRKLRRMPRQVDKATAKRASVLLPLCHHEGRPSVLFTRRSDAVGTHKLEVCFPGGMVDATDQSIIETGLREVEEELGISRTGVDVLGIMRCDWSEVASLTGVGVTPVLGYIGELEDIELQPNAEVDSWFAVGVETLRDERHWVEREYSAPVFTGGPHVVWGLTSYLLAQFVQGLLDDAPRVDLLQPATEHTRS